MPDEWGTCDLTPVTEQPMIRPCRRTPLYQLGPMRLIFTSLKPAALNHCTTLRQVRAAVLGCQYAALHQQQVPELEGDAADLLPYRQGHAS